MQFAQTGKCANAGRAAMRRGADSDKDVNKRAQAHISGITQQQVRLILEIFFFSGAQRISFVHNTHFRTHARTRTHNPRCRGRVGRRLQMYQRQKTIFLPSLSPCQRRRTWHHIKAPQVNKRKEMSTQDTSMFFVFWLFFFLNSWGSAAVYTRCAPSGAAGNV